MQQGDLIRHKGTDWLGTIICPSGPMSAAAYGDVFDVLWFNGKVESVYSKNLELVQKGYKSTKKPLLYE